MHEDDDTPDELVPDPKAWRELGVSPMTGWRWDQRSDLGFPPKIKIGLRNYRSRKQLEAFKARLIRSALQQLRPTESAK
jgi:hypothetical protein